MFKVAGKAKMLFLGNPKNKKSARNVPLNEWSIEATGSGSLPIHEGVLKGAPAAVGLLINHIGQLSRSLCPEQPEQTKSQAVGSVLGASEDIAIAATQFAGLPAKEFQVFKPGKSLNEVVESNSNANVLKGEIELKVGVKYKKKPSDKEGSWEITIDYVKTGQYQHITKALRAAQENAIDFVNLKQESTSRLFTYKRENGKWSINPELQ